MANELQVDANGLRVAAAASGAVASLLVGADSGGITVAQPSGAGVAAMNAALTSLQSRQSSRITDQAGDLSVSGAKYEGTDSSSSDAITTVSV
ncbi:hypothetical protein [Mycolicibacterium litorale]|uniref:Uncharacterized protein n=2 Tax=Mycolicibacterium litorale TaxID=758802 RepID=A0AAD1INH1_9MYCO|nr:hypothetical protein [Mycolicibacterium litorale]MCV7416523.1 hypothetical protein [Mycolicibacterium litorale]TDY09776.1 hypothetical protein BCL50_1873 [Mycolicibacterium litorale]BBY17723.1 hypothetical protein MLIT_33150 [Mycolicibacterium litorale]